MTCNMNIREVYTLFWVGTLKERDHLEGLDVGGRITLKYM
jgi:hypothetical protein